MNAPFATGPLFAERAGYDDLLMAPSRERRRLQCYLMLVLVDVVAVLIGYGAIGYVLWGGHMPIGTTALHLQLVMPLFLALALYNGSYSTASLQHAWSGILRALTALLIAVAAVMFIEATIRAETGISHMGLVGGTMCAALVMIGARLQMRALVRWRCGDNVLNELLIDDGGPTVMLHGVLRVSAKAMGLRPNLNDPNALDRLGLVLRNIDRVIVSCPVAQRAAWAMMLKGANVDGEVLDDEVARLGAQGARVNAGHGLLMVSAGPLGLRQRAMKRGFDLLLAGGAVVALAPLLLAVALAIKLQDGGPVFFTQRRMGRGNRFFSMYKFRSMTQSLCDRDGCVSASRNDQRITPLGRFIRRTSIDELPQLFNVLMGDMSLVGPRPHATGSLAGDKLFWEVDLRYWQRHSLKPGLSGLAQVRGFRGATDHEADLVNRLQADLEYLEGWTVMRDIQIVLLTLRVLVHDRAF